ncbi:hypothetical protein IQ249_00320 [Lusitaniella coriacea LEGE 07157]|uniref:Tic20 family protein Ycf60 n=1 Tax=Lusitaniella coriacea LEGE 07157 TaxID=945747 RepID=A0A8J7B6I0_9CYAN|nr:Tic20 family protein [Lusitaniella coriacea]MBE9114331.1 hypothetical protein [Lusitaniella coriacea LEGE 07157]
MAWHGSTDTKDRIFAALPYLLPLFYVVYAAPNPFQPFSYFLLKSFAILRVILIPLEPVKLLYTFIPFAGLVIFFVLFLAVVRNERISHFIRFNTLQAILLDLLLFLLALAFNIIVNPLLGGNLFALEIVYNIVFLGVLALCGYGIVQSLLGRYAEIPNLSEAVYAQVR